MVIISLKKYNSYISNNEKYLGKIMVKNIFAYIGLLIITGMICTIYAIRNSNILSYDSLVGILVIFILLFFNLFGYIQAVININKIYLIIISHVIFIVSTILIFKLTNYCVNILIGKEIISECSSIIFWGIIMIMENIISYGLIKTYIIKCKKRGNGT
jgi:hypothetical protein